MPAISARNLSGLQVGNGDFREATSRNDGCGFSRDDPSGRGSFKQWAASSGCDALPYFRIFNRVTQSKKFDPQGISSSATCRSRTISARSRSMPWLFPPDSDEPDAEGLAIGLKARPFRNLPYAHRTRDKSSSSARLPSGSRERFLPRDTLRLHRRSIRRSGTSRFS